MIPGGLVSGRCFRGRGQLRGNIVAEGGQRNQDDGQGGEASQQDDEDDFANIFWGVFHELYS